MCNLILDLAKRASNLGHLDDAVALIQEEMGIIDASVADAAFGNLNNEDFKGMGRRERVGRLHEYAQREAARANRPPAPAGAGQVWGLTVVDQHSGQRTNRCYDQPITWS